MVVNLPKPLLFALLCGFTVLFLYHRSSTMTSYSGNQQASAWSSDFAGWRARATTLPDPASFKATPDNLVFAALYSVPVNPEGFTLALFSPNVAVDASGALLRVEHGDFDGLVQLAHAVNELPNTGEFRNQWRVRQPITSRPIDRIFVKSGAGVRETSVYGWTKETTVLEEPVGTTNTLPGPLYQLVGLVREAREGYEKGTEDRSVIDRVKALLGGISTL